MTQAWYAEYGPAQLDGIWKSKEEVDWVWRIKNSVYKRLLIWDIWDIQVEMTIKQLHVWIWKSMSDDYDVDYDKKRCN